MLRSLTRVALLATLVSSPLVAQTTRLNGDVTNDGQITATDAQAVLMAAVDLPLLATYDKAYGDADCDGKVTARDAQIILSSVVQLDVSAFCVGKPSGGGVALVTVDFGTGNVVVGGELQLTATPRDSTNKEITGRTATWTTSDATKATVTSAGIVKGVAVGTATITATVEGKAGVVPVTVIAATGTTSFTISPNVATVLKDSSVQLSPVVRDAAGNPVTGSTVTWSTSDATKATVSSTGLVKGLALGSVIITAKTAGFTDATAQVSIVSLAAQANRTWNGSVSTDWSVAGNWTPSGVPIATDTISVPSAPVNQPELKTGATVAGIVVAVGAKLNIGTNELQVTGRVDVDGEVLGTGKLTIQGLNQSTSYVRGKLPSINITGSTVMVGPVTVTGSMEQVATSILDLNGFTVKVSKDVNIRGAIKQTTAASILDVRGNARFFTDASTTQTVLTGGTLRVGGDFAVVVPTAATNATSPFPSSGQHRVILDGSVKQTVADTGLVTVVIQELLIQNTSGGVEFKTALPTQRFVVMTRLTGTTGVPITGTGRVVVGTHFTSAAGGSVTLRNLSVGGILTAGADFKPDTLTWTGSSQIVPAGAAYQYQNVVAAGSASLTGTTSFAGGLALGCVTPLAGCPVAALGTLDIAGKKLTVAKNLQQAANASGSMLMKTTTDSVVVLGGVLGRLAAPDTSEFEVLAGAWLHGWLRVGGDLRVKGSGPGGAAGATHNVILDGAVQQKLQSRNGFNFHHLTIADSLGVVMNDTTAAGRSRIVTVAADLNITTAVKLTGSGRMDVAGNVQTTTGSGVEISALSVGSILRASGSFTPDTAEFTSTSVVQTIQNLPAYKNVHVKGKAIFGGSMTFSGSLIVAPGAELNVESRHVQVTNRLIVNGLLRMQDGRDTLSALGDSAIFSGTVENNKAYATAGVLRVAGGLRMDSSSFYPTGSHKVMLIGEAARGVRGGFQDLEIAGNGAITLQNVVVRGSLSGSTPATLVFDTVTVAGVASFAQAANITVKLAAPATAITSIIKGDLLGAQTMAITSTGKLQIDGKLASTGALTSTGTTGGVLTVGGDLTFGAGSSITAKKVAVKGIIGSADGLTPDTLVLYGAGTLPASAAYKTLIIAGQSVLGGNSTATKLVVNCQPTTGVVTACATDATRPSFDLNGKVMVVTGTMEQTGKVIMTRAADTLSVRGNFTINRPYGRTYTNGVLMVGGNLTSSVQTTPGDTAVAFAVRNTDGTYAKGTKIVLDGVRTTYQQVTGLDPEFIMSDVDIVNRGGLNGAVRFGSQTGGPTKFTILGGLTIGRLEFYTPTMNVVVNGDVVMRDSAYLSTSNLIYKAGYSHQGAVASNGGARHAKLKTIRWLTQPQNRTAGQNFTPDIQVEAVDSTDARLNGQVPIALTLNNQVIWLVTQAGLATVTATAPTTAGTLTIPATTFAPGQASAITVNSASFTVTAGAAAKVAVTSVKTTVVAGANLTQASTTGGVLLRITDAYGNWLSTGAGAVTMTTTPTSPDTVAGTRTGTLASGQATIAGMSLRKVGKYQLLANVSGLTAVPSDTITVTHAPVGKVAMKTQPPDTKLGQQLLTFPSVELRDVYDNLVTSGGAPTVSSVVVNRVAGTGAATLTATYTPSFNQALGVVTLNNFVVTAPTQVPSATTYTMTVTINGSLTVTSAVFTVSPP